MSVPIGTIISWYGNPLKKPNFYEYCDGSLLRLPEQEALAGYLVAANPSLFLDSGRVRFPDLRGEFLRGFDNGRGVDVGRSIGSEQKDEFKEHFHKYADTFNTEEVQSDNSDERAAGTKLTRREQTTTWAGGKETRPRNIAVSYLIKVTKNGEEQPLSTLLDQVAASDPDNRELIKFLTDLVKKGV